MDPSSIHLSNLSSSSARSFASQREWNLSGELLLCNQQTIDRPRPVGIAKKQPVTMRDDGPGRHPGKSTRKRSRRGVKSAVRAQGSESPPATQENPDPDPASICGRADNPSGMSMQMDAGMFSSEGCEFPGGDSGIAGFGVLLCGGPLALPPLSRPGFLHLFRPGGTLFGHDGFHT